VTMGVMNGKDLQTVLIGREIEGKIANYKLNRENMTATKVWSLNIKRWKE
jgi:hypothetical protein